MKLFKEENGKEVVYIQCKDLNLISKIEHLSRCFDQNIQIETLIMSNKEEYVRLEKEETVNLLKTMSFIVDFDEFQKLTTEEIYSKINENKSEIDKLKKQIKHEKKENVKPLMDAYMTRDNYINDMLLYLNYREKSEYPEYKGLL